MRENGDFRIPCSNVLAVDGGLLDGYIVTHQTSPHQLDIKYDLRRCLCEEF